MPSRPTTFCRVSRVMAAFFLAISLNAALQASPLGLAGEDLAAAPAGVHKSPAALFDGSRRFQFELYGGAAQPGLSAFNSLVDNDNRIQEFTFERLLDFLQQQGEIISWTKNQQSGRKKIALSFPLGVRFRYRLSRRFSVSLGARASLGRREKDFSFEYTRRESLNYEDRESVKYSPYLLSARSLAVQAGFHYHASVSRKLTLEAFLAAGPVFADCRYSSDWEYIWHRKGPDMDFDVSRMTGHLEEMGKGTGIAADMGARIQYPVMKRLALFLEGVYSRQVVKKITGKGWEIRGDVETAWEGKWAIKKEMITAPWGTTGAAFPTNYWPEGSASSRVGDFRLDFSGFQARIGLCLFF